MFTFHYAWGRLLVQLIFRLATRACVTGLDRIPPREPCLLLCNHISHFDPPVLACWLPRMVHFVTSAEFYHPAWFGRYLKTVHTIPFDRSLKTDNKSIKEVLRRLQAGALVGIFPERGIRHGAASVLRGAELPEGTASLAQLAGVPVVPAVILGTDQLYRWQAWFTRPRLFIHYGTPFVIGRKEDRAEATRLLGEKMRALLEEIHAQHGIKKEEWPVSAQERWGQRPPLSPL